LLDAIFSTLHLVAPAMNTRDSISSDSSTDGLIRSGSNGSLSNGHSHDDVNNNSHSIVNMIRSKSSPMELSETGNDDKDIFKHKRNESFNDLLSENFQALASAAEQSLHSLPKPPEKVVSMWKAFRDFAFQGSVIDLAVGIIIGGAFGKIINSFVNDIIMPPIGWLLSGVDFANIYVTLKRGRKNKLTNGRYKSLAHAKEDGAVTVNVGVFFNTVLNFVVISLIIFLFVRTIDKLKRKEKGSTLMKKCPYCISKVHLHAVKCAYCLSELKDNCELSNDDEDEEHNHHKGKNKMLKKNLKKQISSMDFTAFI